MSALEKQNRSDRDALERRQGPGLEGGSGMSSIRQSGHGPDTHIHGAPVEYRRTPWYTTLAVWLVVIVVAAGVLYAYREPLIAMVNPHVPAPVVAKPPSITVTKATSGAITESVVVTGNLVAREEILVSPQIEGYAIDKIMVEEGDRVSEGQVMATLSRTTIDTSLAQNEAQSARADAAIAQAQSSIAEAAANKDQAASAFVRAQTLVKSGNTTAETLDQREAAAKMADARVDAAQHALTVAQADKKLADAQRSELMVRLEHTQIRAPAGGIVSRRTARIGAIASAAGDPLFRIIRDGDVELEADVPEMTLARMKPDMKAEVSTASRPEPVTAHVRLVSPEVSPATRLGRVRIAIDQAPGLTIGTFARANVQIASHDGVLVPQSAVLYTEEGASVQVVKGDTVSTRSVTLGLRTESQAEIVKGVEAGDAIVATAGTFVRDGDKVTPVEAAAAAAQAK